MEEKNVGAILAIVGGSLGMVQFLVEPEALPIHPSIVSAIGGVLMFVSAVMLFSILRSGDSRGSTDS